MTDSHLTDSGAFSHGSGEPLGGDLEKEEAVQAGAGQEGRRQRAAGPALSSSYSDAEVKALGPSKQKHSRCGVSTQERSACCRKQMVDTGVRPQVWDRVTS